MTGQPAYQPDMSQSPAAAAATAGGAGGFVGGQDAAQTGYAQMHARQHDPQVRKASSTVQHLTLQIVECRILTLQLLSSRVQDLSSLGIVL